MRKNMSLKIVSENREDIKEILYELAIKDTVKIKRLTEEYRYNKNLYEIEIEAELNVIDNLSFDGKNTKELYKDDCEIL